jgi:hypothetical protein
VRGGTRPGRREIPSGRNVPRWSCSGATRYTPDRCPGLRASIVHSRSLDTRTPLPRTDRTRCMFGSRCRYAQYHAIPRYSRELYTCRIRGYGRVRRHRSGLEEPDVRHPGATTRTARNPEPALWLQSRDDARPDVSGTEQGWASSSGTQRVGGSLWTVAATQSAGSGRGPIGPSNPSRALGRSGTAGVTRTGITLRGIDGRHRPPTRRGRVSRRRVGTPGEGR